MKAGAYRSLASSVHNYAAKGLRKFLVTSSGPGEGKSTVTTNLGFALARSGRKSVVLVDVDPWRPTLHKILKVENERGIGNLLHDIYQVDLRQEHDARLGLGDWVEILRAQGRSGKLLVKRDAQEYSVLFDRGKISSIYTRQRPEQRLLGSLLVEQGTITAEQKVAALNVQQDGDRRLGDILHGLGYVERREVESALQQQLRDFLHEMVTLSGPKYQFTDASEGYLPAVPGRQPSRLEVDGIDHFVSGRFSQYLKQPFLSERIPDYLTSTDIPNFKVLTSGSLPYDLSDPSFAILIERLGRMFDVVLMDCPPVALTSPTMVVSTLADGVLMVVQADGYDVQIVKRARNQLLESGANLLGVVLNKVNLKHDKSLFYYYGAYRGD